MRTEGSLKAANSLDELDDAVEQAGRQVDDATLQSVVRGEDAPTPRVKQHVLAEGGPDVDSLPSNLRTSGKTVQAKQAMEAVSPDVRSALTRAQRSELLRHLAESPGAVRLVNDVGPEGTSRLFRMTFDDADAATVRANLFDRYAKLQPDSQARTTFARLTEDPDLGHSWVRVVSDEEIPTREVEIALYRVDEVSEFGHVTEFHVGRDLNQELPYADPEPVHKPDSIAVDYEIDQETTFYRFYNEGAGGSDLRNDYTFRDRRMVEQYSVGEISDRLSLPNDPDAVAVVRIDPSEVSYDIQMRASTVADNTWGAGGGTQYIFRSDFKDSWFEHSEELTGALTN